MTPAPKSATNKKRKYKPKNPPGPDQEVINWKEEELRNLVQNFGNFRLPISKFVGEVLTGYGLHISQINALGLPRLTHFEFICWASHVDPTFEKFNTFYFVTYTSGFYSFNSRTGGVEPCSRDPPNSLHDWKQKFFYIRRDVIPIDMHYRLESEGILRVNVSIDFTEQEWYNVLTRKVTSIIQLEDWALVAAGMSMLWASQNPRGFLVYGYRGKGILAVLTVVASLPEGRPLWLDQIRDNFLHPSTEILANYANTILGDDGEDDIDFDVNPTREEPVLLSSEESDDASFHLIRRSRAGPQRGPSEEPAADDVDTPVVDLQAGATEQTETRKKKKEDKTGDKKAEEPAAKTPPASKPRYSRSKVDISNITPPTSPPSKPLELSPPRPDSKWNGKEGDVEVEQVEKVMEDVVAGARRDEAHVEGVETEVESSEATPQGTIYTKRVRGSGGRGTSGTHQSPEFHRIQGGSWTSHYLACIDLPHAPHWTLTQGSRMNDLSNYRDLYILSPLLKDCSKKTATGWIYWMTTSTLV
ncbi:hypothetical protein Hanom_Chr17g01581731 [Helianthus anomalus]